MTAGAGEVARLVGRVGAGPPGGLLLPARLGVGLVVMLVRSFPAWNVCVWGSRVGWG